MACETSVSSAEPVRGAAAEGSVIRAQALISNRGAGREAVDRARNRAGWALEKGGFEVQERGCGKNVLHLAGAVRKHQV